MMLYAQIVMSVGVCNLALQDEEPLIKHRPQWNSAQALDALEEAAAFMQAQDTEIADLPVVQSRLRLAHI